jgi:hypothetical protein
MTPTPTTVDQATVLVFQIVLTANQTPTRVPVPIPKDADFLLTGIHGTSTGDFSMNFLNPDGSQFANVQLHKANILGTPTSPFPIGPPSYYGAGSNGPMLDLTELTGATNTLELCFDGIKRMRVKTS